MQSFSTFIDESRRKRRVFFSFHYRDIWVVNQVRNSWRFQHKESREAAGFFDASLWERSQREHPDSLKQLIRTGLQNTSVTCVLAGPLTYQRRWVRYEIARSLERGNGLFVVHLDQRPERGGLLSREVQGTGARHRNPLDYLGIRMLETGKIRLFERSGGLLSDAAAWREYDDYQQAFKAPVAWTALPSDTVVPLSRLCAEYLYYGGNGPKSFANWVNAAADKVGRA